MHDWDPEYYNKNSLLQYKGAMNFLSKHIGTFKKDSINVLDVGCGDGKITQTVAEMLNKSKVLGIDSSFEMIKYASKKCSEKNVSFKMIDVCQLNFIEEFELIISFYCLQWVENKKLAFKKIADALKPYGTILLNMPIPYDYYIDIMDEMVKEKKWESYFKNYRNPHHTFLDSNYSIYAINAGFKNISVSICTDNFNFNNREELYNFLNAIMPNFLQSDQKIKSEFISELTDRYIAYEKSISFKYINYQLKSQKTDKLSPISYQSK